MLIDSNKLVWKRFRKSNSIGWGIIRDSYTTVNIIIGNTLRWYTNCPYSKQYYISKMIKMKQTLIVVCSSNIQLVIMCVKRHVITYTDAATVKILKVTSANIKTQTEFSLSCEGRTYNNLTLVTQWMEFGLTVLEVLIKPTCRKPSYLWQAFKESNLYCFELAFWGAKIFIILYIGLQMR